MGVILGISICINAVLVVILYFKFKRHKFDLMANGMMIDELGTAVKNMKKERKDKKEKLEEIKDEKGNLSAASAAFNSLRKKP